MIIGIIVVVVFSLVAIFLLITNKKNDTLNFDIDLFISLLGGKDNLISSSATISKVTLEIVNYEVVNVEGLKKMGATGVVFTGNRVSIILGQISKDIQLVLEKNGI